MPKFNISTNGEITYVSERVPSGAADQLPVPKPEADPRLEKVASLHLTLKESEGGYTFAAYASDPRETTDYWVVHVMQNGKVLYDTTIPRLDGGGFSHNDLTILGKTVDELKRAFNPELYVHPSL